MKFAKVVDARRAIWERLSAELQVLSDLGTLDDDCDDEFDLRRMEMAIRQVQESIQKRIRKGAGQ